MPRYEIPLTCIHPNGRTETTIAKANASTREQAVTEAVTLAKASKCYAEVTPFLDSDKSTPLRRFSLYSRPYGTVL
jgi:hypothetical protein